MFQNWKTLLFGLFAAALFLSYLSDSNASYDFWAHLNFGRLAWETKSIPTSDVFSYLPTKSTWYYHEWLSSVLFYLIYKDFGGWGVQLFRYVLSLITLGLVFHVAYKKGNSLFFAGLSVLAAVPLIKFGYAPIRAQIFTYLFFALFLLILERFRKSQNWKILAWIIFIQWVWASLHGGFLAGLGLCFLYLLGEALSKKSWKPYLVVLVLSGVVTLINPYGIKVWQFIVSSSAKGVWPELTEWYSVFQAMGISSMTGFCILHIMLFAFFLLFLCVHKKRDLTGVLVLFVTAFLGFKHIRHIVFFGLAFVVFVPSMADCFWTKCKSTGSVIKWQRYLTTFMFVLFVYWGGIIGLKFYQEFLQAHPFELKAFSFSEAQASDANLYYPVAAVDYLKKNKISGNILAPFEWGSYLTWHLYPESLIALDGRCDLVFADSVAREYFDFRTGIKNEDFFLKKYPHNIIISPNKIHVPIDLSNDRKWQRKFFNAGYSLYVKEHLNSTHNNQ